MLVTNYNRTKVVPLEEVALLVTPRNEKLQNDWCLVAIGVNDPKENVITLFEGGNDIQNCINAMDCLLSTYSNSLYRNDIIVIDKDGKSWTFDEVVAYSKEDDEELDLEENVSTEIDSEEATSTVVDSAEEI